MFGRGAGNKVHFLSEGLHCVCVFVYGLRENAFPSLVVSFPD